MDVNVPTEFAFKLWEDREKIPEWMPLITSVNVRKEFASTCGLETQFWNISVDNLAHCFRFLHASSLV